MASLGEERNEEQTKCLAGEKSLEVTTTEPRRVKWLQQLKAMRPAIIILLAPLLFLPIPVILPGKAARCGYIILVMAVYWATEVIPMAVTALIPIAAMPWLGVASSHEVCPQYFHDANVMFFSGLMLATAVEKWNLHKRIALRALMFMGSKPIWIMFGFMMITAVLSMFISNTGATAMIIPIAVAVLDELALCNQQTKDVTVIHEIELDNVQSHDDDDDAKSSSAPLQNVVTSNNNATKNKTENDFGARVEPVCAKRSVDRAVERAFKRFSAALTLSIALAANIGGTATLIGCGPNVALAGIIEKLYGSDSGVNFISWLSFAFPTMIINLVLSWLILGLMFLGIRMFSRNDGSPRGSETIANAVFRREYANLGPWSFAEGSLLFLFAIVVVLWITRKPDIFPGWSSLLGHTYATEASVGITICIILFLWPSQRPNYAFFRRKTDRSEPVTTPALLDWPTVHEHLPWSVVILLGGGFALAFCCKVSGLSADISQFLSAFRSLPQWLVLMLVCILGTVSSTFAGIIPTATILLPIVGELGQILHINPLALMINVAFAASYSYTLPVSTPPNAIVYAYARFTLMEMVKSGAVMCVVHILVLQVALSTWGRPIYQLHTFPDWALPPNATSTGTT